MDPDKFARSFAKRFAVDIDPNFVSLSSFILAILSSLTFYKGLPVLGGILVALCGFLDLIDGEIARKYGKKSKKGDFVDHSLDRLADLAIFLGLGIGSFVPLVLALFAAIANQMVAYLGTLAQSVGQKRFYGGLAKRSNIMVLIFIGAVCQVFFPFSLKYTVYLVLFLSIITFLQRFLKIFLKLS